MSAEKKPAIRKRWRYFTRRHAFLAALIVGGGALLLILLALFLYRLGFVDRYVAGQIKIPLPTTAFAPRSVSFTPRFHLTLSR
jgi:hypothetical protein